MPAPPATAATCRVWLDCTPPIMGADVRLVSAGFRIGFKESWEQALADVA